MKSDMSDFPLISRFAALIFANVFVYLSNFAQIAMGDETLKGNYPAFKSTTEETSLKKNKLDSEDNEAAKQALDECLKLSRTEESNTETIMRRYDEAVSRHPNYSPLYRSRGFKYLCLGQYQKAVDDLSKAISIDPNSDVWIYQNRSDAYDGLGLKKLANKDMETFWRLYVPKELKEHYPGEEEAIANSEKLLDLLKSPTIIKDNLKPLLNKKIAFFGVQNGQSSIMVNEKIIVDISFSTDNLTGPIDNQDAGFVRGVLTQVVILGTLRTVDIQESPKRRVVIHISACPPYPYWLLKRRI